MATLCAVISRNSKGGNAVRNWIAAALILVLGLSLTACGNDNAGTSPTVGTTLPSSRPTPVVP